MEDVKLYNVIGAVTKKYRQKLNMSQAELAKGICNPSHIAHIESGRRTLNAILLFQISEKLKIPLEKFFSPCSYELTKMMTGFTMMCSSDGNSSKIVEYINFIEGNLSFASKKDTLLIESLKIFIKAVETEQYKEGIEEIQKLLDAYTSHDSYISPIEFAVENGIYYLHYLSGDVEYAYLKYRESYHKLHKVLTFENHNYIAKFFIQIAVISIEKGSYDMALRYLDEGIEFSKTESVHSLLPELLYHKGEVLFLKNKSEGMEQIKDAIKLADLICPYPPGFYEYIGPRLKKYDIHIESYKS